MVVPRPQCCCSAVLPARRQQVVEGGRESAGCGRRRTGREQVVVATPWRWSFPFNTHSNLFGGQSNLKLS